MNKLNISKVIKNVKTSMSKHNPEILTGIGIAGMITTTILAVRATPKALCLLERERDFREEENGAIDPLTKFEVIKVTWKCYIPSAITGAISIVCLVGASSSNIRRNTALATAYSLSESALKEYQEKVIETIGEKKEQAVRDEIAKDKINKDPVSNREIFITEKGNTLCYDVVSCRYFKTDIDKIKKAEITLNRRMLDERYVSLNDFYYEIGLTNSSIGDNLGWNIDDGNIDLHFSSQLADDETPCLVVDYHISPKYDYRDQY